MVATPWIYLAKTTILTFILTSRSSDLRVGRGPVIPPVLWAPASRWGKLTPLPRVKDSSPGTGPLVTIPVYTHAPPNTQGPPETSPSAIPRATGSERGFLGQPGASTASSVSVCPPRTA